MEPAPYQLPKKRAEPLPKKSRSSFGSFWLFFVGVDNFGSQLRLPTLFSQKMGVEPLVRLFREPAPCSWYYSSVVSAIFRSRLPKEPAPNWELKNSQKSQNSRLGASSGSRLFFSKKWERSRSFGSFGSCPWYGHVHCRSNERRSSKKKCYWMSVQMDDVHFKNECRLPFISSFIPHFWVFSVIIC